MNRTGTLTVSTPGDREVQMVRVFAAPRRLVFAALSQAELLKRWFSGPPGWSLQTCEIDARAGGRYRYVWHNSGSGEVMGMSGEILEFVAPERMVSSERFDQAWYEGEATSSIVLSESTGQTTLTLTVRYASSAVRDAVMKFPMAAGVEMGYDRLAAWLATDEAGAALAGLG